MDSTAALVIVTALAIVLLWAILARGRSGVISSLPPLRRPQVTIVCLRGPLRGQEFPMAGTQLTIGRSPENAIRVDGDLVSRNHALLEYKNRQLMLFDRDSTNGTWVNGQRIWQTQLHPATQFEIGPCIFVAQLAGADEAVPAHDQRSMPRTPPVSIQTSTDLPVRDLGEYRNLTMIGQGGAATVYKGFSSDGIVAIKVLHRSADPYFRHKFEIEGKRIGPTLRHEHLLRIYGMRTSPTQDVSYIVMEYLDGGSLRDRLNQGTLGPDDVRRIIGQTCDALGYAHARGIYHRDIKPENIMFNARGAVKLADFGIARLANQVRRTAVGMIVGTPEYMSYEQAKGQPVDGRSDIYSLGVVMYEILAGQRPFVGEPLAIVDQHLRAQPAPPRRLAPSVPADLEGVVLRAMEKDKKRRFQSAGEMAQSVGYAEAQHTGQQYVPERAGETFGPQPARTGRSYLIVENTHRKIPLAAGRHDLRRNIVNPSDSMISRSHASVYIEGGYVWLQDLNSSNGTYINGIRIAEPVVLRPGDRILIGNTYLRFGK